MHVLPKTHNECNAADLQFLNATKWKMTNKFSNRQTESAPHVIVSGAMQKTVVKDTSTNPMNFPMHHFAGRDVRVTTTPNVENLTCYNDTRRIF